MEIPSGDLIQLWNITIFDGKLTISMAVFNSYVKLPEGMMAAWWFGACFCCIHWEQYTELTNSYFFEGLKPPTRWEYVKEDDDNQYIVDECGQ